MKNFLFFCLICAGLLVMSMQKQTVASGNMLPHSFWLKDTLGVEDSLQRAEMLEAGELIYTGKCTRCHVAKPVDNWTEEEWRPILKSMIRKTKLDSLQSAQVTAYVQANCRKP